MTVLFNNAVDDEHPRIAVTRGLRIKGDDTPIMPGEFRDVDVPGGVIRDNITFLPYKEPSSVLYQLLGNIVEEGRRFASMADLKVADMNSEAPVGTTLAIMERAMKVQSAIQARIHASLKQEYKILAEIIRDYTDPEYPYETDEGEGIKAEDFDDRIDVVPVSDPNASSMAQRIMQYQAAMQLAQQSPGLYDMPLLHREMMDLIGIPNADKIVPMPDEIHPKDPVSENEDLLTLKPVKAFEYQDHEAHITVHMTALQDPKTAQMLQQSPSAEMIHGEMESHVREHLAFQYRKDIEDELGTELPPIGEELPNDLEKELSKLVVQAAERVTQKHAAEIEQERIQEQMQDPLILARQKELEIKEADVQRRATTDQAKIQLETQKAIAKDALEKERIESQERIAGASIGQRIASDMQDSTRKDKELEIKQVQKIVDITKSMTEDSDRESE